MNFLKQIFFLIIFIFFNLVAFTQIIQNSNTSKNTIKLSPTLNFGWSSALKSTNSNYKSFKLMTGLNINYLREDKLKNYHDIGFIIGIIPTKNSSIINENSKQIGIAYNYKIVYAKYKDHQFKIFTAIGTQLIYTKTLNKSTENFKLNYKSKSIEQNVVVSPGIQYSKNHFYLDFSLPTSIGYKHLSQYHQSDNPIIQSDTQKHNLLDWNLGIQTSVGAKF